MNPHAIRSTALAGFALAVSAASVTALAGPKPTEVDYYIPPLNSGAVNPNPFFASGVSVGRNVDLYGSAGTGPAGPAGRNPTAAAGTPERFIDPDFFPDFVLPIPAARCPDVRLLPASRGAPRQASLNPVQWVWTGS